jgi:hypothetical protein
MGAIAKIEEVLGQYAVPAQTSAEENVLYLIANGDLRDSANQTCWEEQQKLEEKLSMVIESMKDAQGRPYKVVRAHAYDPKLKHGFINSQKLGNKVFKNIPPNATVIVVEAVWQYSHHILGALVAHKGPILTVANWSGTWPGLVGLANLNASLTKHARQYSSLWSEDFSDDFFLNGLKEFLQTGNISHDTSHAHLFAEVDASDYADAIRLGNALADHLQYERAIIGPLDEMCMGMENGVFGNELLYSKGMGKENISQSELLARMGTVSDEDGWAVIQWCMDKGMTFEIGTDEATELTKQQLTEQGKMYIAAVRIADKYGLDCIGIQYQQGLKDCCPASDLTEGLLNNPERPDVVCDDADCENFGKVIRQGDAIPCFNEVDEGCAVDLVLSSRVWKALGMDPSANQEDVRWSRPYTGTIETASGTLDVQGEEVWIELLSGSSPASHFVGGYAGASSERQPPMYFPLGGGTLKGVGKSGEVVWSRAYIDEEGDLCLDLGRGGICGLPEEETNDRWQKTTPQWPIKHLIRYGATRNQFMAKHKSNHETILYAHNAEMANQALFAKAAMAEKLGFKVYVCGSVNVEESLEHRAQKAG